MKVLFTLILLVLGGITFSQSYLDSVYAVWEDESQPDTVRLQSLNSYIGRGYVFSDPDTAKILAEEQFAFAKEVENYYWMAVAKNTVGITFAIRSEEDSAIAYYKEAVDFYVIAQDARGVAQTFNNIALTYQFRGEYTNAIFYHSNVFKVGQFIADTALMCASKVNLAGVYKDLGDSEHAFQDYKEAYDMSFSAYGSVDGEIISAIGNAYVNRGNYDSAFVYFEEALLEHEKRGNRSGKAGTLVSMGSAYCELGDFEKGLSYFEEGILIQEEMNIVTDLCGSYIGFSENLLEVDRKSEALIYATKGLNIAKANDFKKEVHQGAKVLYEIQLSLGNNTQALKMLELSVAAKDSLDTQEGQFALIAQSLRHEFEKEEELAEIEYKLDLAHQKEVLEQGKMRDSIILYSVSIGLFLVLVFCVFLINRFRITRAQKEVIELQKLTVETKNKEIVDSINYAQRIQSAILPPDRKLKRLLPDSFVSYLPKDIVAGDFYWVEKVQNKIIFAVGDCTGHGVPGAMVSVVCHNALNRTIREFMLTEPGKILDKTNELVEEAFEASEGTVRDGMDIALCSYDESSGKLTYSGANNPLWIIRNGEILETKGDKQPIGSFNEHKPFSTHEITLQKDDLIYIFSDGIADQFGGPEGKKYKYKRLKELLLDICKKPLVDQRKLIEKTHLEWKGELDQLDDICLMGLRV